MMGSGLRGRSTAMGCGKLTLATIILGSGSQTWLMAMGCMSGPMGIVMRESGSCVWGMARVQISLQMEMCTWASTVTAEQKAMASTFGKMGTPTAEFLKMGWKTVKEFGKKLRKNLPICMRENSGRTWSMEWENLGGRQVGSTEDVTTTI